MGPWPEPQGPWGGKPEVELESEEEVVRER